MAGKEDASPKSERAEAGAEIGAESAASAAAAAAAAVDPPLAEEAGADSGSEINWVEMPLNTLRWILGKKRESDPVPKLQDFGIYTQEDLDKKDADMLIRRTIASLQSAQDDFFEFQAWVRETYMSNGRVMVPEGVVGPKDQLQKALDEDWADAFAAISLDPDPEASDLHSSTKQVLQSKF